MMRFVEKNVDTGVLSLSNVATSLVADEDRAWLLAFLTGKELDWCKPGAKHMYIHNKYLGSWTACRGKLTTAQKEARDNLTRRLKDEYKVQRKAEPANKKKQVRTDGYYRECEGV